MPITTGNTPKALTGDRMASWMQPHGSGSTVVKHPGSLRATAKRMGLVHGDAKLSSHALSVMKKKGGAVTRKRVALAKVFKGAHHAHHPPARG
jgi:hypothetical protein